MFNLLKVFQGEPRISETAAKALRGLCGTEQNKRQVVAAGSVKLLCDLLIQSNIKEVITGTCGILARLATLPEVRQNYLHAIVPYLTSFLVNNDADLQLPIVLILQAITKDGTCCSLLLPDLGLISLLPLTAAGTHEIMNTAGCTVQLILLLDSLSVELQEQTLTTLSNIIFEGT